MTMTPIQIVRHVSGHRAPSDGRWLFLAIAAALAVLVARGLL